MRLSCLNSPGQQYPTYTVIARGLYKRMKNDQLLTRLVNVQHGLRVRFYLSRLGEEAKTEALQASSCALSVDGYGATYTGSG